jgi:UDP-N-acetylglucosamine--N-acetylmuramyl-(pentapeptide) pyrophosphoryl-undecaprenol N-acetylglucosamine transferase
MNCKFVIACGGTGGHLSPGIALAQKLTGSGHDCQLFISQKQVDARLIKKYEDLKYVPVPGVGFSLHPVRLSVFVFSLARSIFFAFNWLRKWRPDVVVAFGGYISVGVVLSAYLLHIPIVLHEANRKPGRSVRLMRKLATRIYLPDGIRLRGINPSRIRYYGYPVRQEIFRGEIEKSRQALGFNITGKLLVIIGGSQGASIFNKWVVDNFENLSAEGINIFCISGPIHGTDGVIDGISLNGTRVQAVFTSFTDQIPEVLSSADLVISRAGAGTIAEIIRCRTPSILIPYPFAADNHQLANALFFERQGGGVLLHQEKMDHLLEEVKDLISNNWLLSRFQNNLQKMDRINCTELIEHDLLKICGVENESVLAVKGEPA